MKTRAKHLPRLWCALQGLLPFEACLAAQRGELAWPAELAEPAPTPAKSVTRPVVAAKPERKSRW